MAGFEKRGKLGDKLCWLQEGDDLSLLWKSIFSHFKKANCRLNRARQSSWEIATRWIVLIKHLKLEIHQASVNISTDLNPSIQHSHQTSELFFNRERITVQCLSFCLLCNSSSSKSNERVWRWTILSLSETICTGICRLSSLAFGRNCERALEAWPRTNLYDKQNKCLLTTIHSQGPGSLLCLLSLFRWYWQSNSSHVGFLLGTYLSLK